MTLPDTNGIHARIERVETALLSLHGKAVADTNKIEEMYTDIKQILTIMESLFKGFEQFKDSPMLSALMGTMGKKKA